MKYLLITLALLLGCAPTTGLIQAGSGSYVFEQDEAGTIKTLTAVKDTLDCTAPAWNADKDGYVAFCTQKAKVIPMETEIKRIEVALGTEELTIKVFQNEGWLLTSSAETGIISKKSVLTFSRNVPKR